MSCYVNRQIIVKDLKWSKETIATPKKTHTELQHWFFPLFSVAITSEEAMNKITPAEIEKMTTLIVMQHLRIKIPEIMLSAHVTPRKIIIRVIFFIEIRSEASIAPNYKTYFVRTKSSPAPSMQILWQVFIIPRPIPANIGKTDRFKISKKLGSPFFWLLGNFISSFEGVPLWLSSVMF